ncbi:MAG TPA: hypothetical protein VK993_15095 [Chthoniobacterales bacterium]|nr:hypothetical protein [Chthoniobacterales bacterium]
MQWFIGINEDCPAFKQYADMAKVAIYTALQHTSLQPHCIYDGSENDFTRWLEHRGVTIIRTQTFLLDELARLGERRRNPDLLRATRGVFLRVELPQLQEQFGLDERVLYTDCDVVFRADVTDVLQEVACKYFAVAIESDRSLPDDMNSGVMWMNLPGLRRRDAEFRDYLRANIDELPSVSWDQGAYRSFYRSPDRVPLWDGLPPELNWKPYWEDYASAKIIHFHGPKPFQRNYIDSHWPELKFLTGGHYHELCELWEALLHEAQ